MNIGSNDAVVPWFVRECWLGARGTTINLGNNYVDVQDARAVFRNGSVQYVMNVGNCGDGRSAVEDVRGICVCAY